MSITRPTPIKAVLKRGINDAQHVMFNGALKVLESIEKYDRMQEFMLVNPDFCDAAINNLASLHFRSARYQQVFIDVYGITASQAIKVEPPCAEFVYKKQLKEWSDDGIAYAVIKSEDYTITDGEKCYTYTFKRLSDEALRLWEGLIND